MLIISKGNKTPHTIPHIALDYTIVLIFYSFKFSRKEPIFTTWHASVDCFSQSY